MGGVAAHVVAVEVKAPRQTERRRRVQGWFVHAAGGVEADHGSDLFAEPPTLKTIHPTSAES